jgi:hypothetical protein
MKKLMLCALAALAPGAGPAVAQAAPQWLSEGQPIPAGVVVAVATSGKLTMTLSKQPGRTFVSTVTCKVKDEETIQNGPNGGSDEITAMTFAGCKSKPSPCPAGAKLEVLAYELPWRSALLAGPPITDGFATQLELRCGGNPLTFVEDLLTPEVGKSTLTFSRSSGSLAGPLYTMEIAGTDKLEGPKGDKTITAS